MIYARFFIILMPLLLSIPALAASGDVSPLSQIEAILKQEEEIQPKLHEKLRASLKEMQTLTLSLKSKDFDSLLSDIKEKVEGNQSNIAENLLRINFLICLRDSMSANPITDVKKDMEKILMDLAFKQIVSSAESNIESSTWFFEISLSIAIRDVFEPSENFGQFIKSYMIYSSLGDPKSPSGFLSERTYIGK